MRTINVMERAYVGGGEGGENTAQLPEDVAISEDVSLRPVQQMVSVGRGCWAHPIFKFPQGYIPREWLR